MLRSVRPLATQALILTAVWLVLEQARPARAMESAVMTGTVVDAGGHPIAGALVSIETEGVSAASTRTRADGRYRFPALRPRAVYRARAEATGRRSVEYDGLYLDASRTRVVDFRLKAPGEWDVVVLASHDPFPYEELVRSFRERLKLPVRVIDLDAEPDPAERARRVAAEKPNLVLGTGLRAARLIRREVRDVPSILTLIDDPRRYDLEAPNLCFLANNPDADSVLREMSVLLPRAGRIGIVYDSEASSMLARDLREAAGRRGLRVVLRPLYGGGSTAAALDSIRDQIDALLVPYDPLTASPRTIDRITGWARRRRMPLVAPGPDWVRAGALFGFGATPGQIGLEAGEIASRILAQTLEPLEVRLRSLPRPLLAVNRRAAADLGISLPPELRFDFDY